LRHPLGKNIEITIIAIIILLNKNPIIRVYEKYVIAIIIFAQLFF